LFTHEKREFPSGVKGTLNIWPEYIGKDDGDCEKRSIEITNSAQTPYYNVIFVEPYQGQGKGDAHVWGPYSQIMEVALGHTERDFGHELGHMIGYEHPHGDDTKYKRPDDTLEEFKNDIMVQSGNSPNVGKGTSSHPAYMWSKYVYVRSGNPPAVHGMILVNTGAIMKK
jgi:hypothetical protein